NSPPLFGVADRFLVNFGDERTGGINGPQFTQRRCGPDLRRDPMGAIKHGCAFRNLFDAIDEYHAFLSKALDDRAVVADLVIGIDRRAIELNSPIEAINGHHDAGTEPTRIGEDHFHREILHHRARLSYRPAAFRTNRGPPKTATPPIWVASPLVRTRACDL